MAKIVFSDFDGTLTLENRELTKTFFDILELLQQHPHLPRVILHTGQQNGELQLGSTRNEAENLHAWFSSLENAHIVASPWFDEGEHKHAYVAVHGQTTDGLQLRVWDKVHGLGEFLGYTAGTDSERHEVADSVLVDFALTEHPQDAA